MKSFFFHRMSYTCTVFSLSAWLFLIILMKTYSLNVAHTLYIYIYIYMFFVKTNYTSFPPLTSVHALQFSHANRLFLGTSFPPLTAILSFPSIEDNPLLIYARLIGSPKGSSGTILRNLPSRCAHFALKGKCAPNKVGLQINAFGAIGLITLLQLFECPLFEKAGQ